VKNIKQLFNEQVDRFHLITQKGIDANAVPSDETRHAVRECLIKLMALKKLVQLLLVVGDNHIPDKVMLDVAEALNRYDDCCKADCELVG
jgi:hypothetical protein